MAATEGPRLVLSSDACSDMQFTAGTMVFPEHFPAEHGVDHAARRACLVRLTGDRVIVTALGSGVAATFVEGGVPETLRTAAQQASQVRYGGTPMVSTHHASLHLLNFLPCGCMPQPVPLPLGLDTPLRSGDCLVLSGHKYLVSILPPASPSHANATGSASPSTDTARSSPRAAAGRSKAKSPARRKHRSKHASGVNTASRPVLSAPQGRRSFRARRPVHHGSRVSGWSDSDDSPSPSPPRSGRPRVKRRRQSQASPAKHGGPSKPFKQPRRSEGATHHVTPTRKQHLSPSKPRTVPAAAAEAKDQPGAQPAIPSPPSVLSAASGLAAGSSDAAHWSPVSQEPHIQDGMELSPLELDPAAASQATEAGDTDLVALPHNTWSAHLVRRRGRASRVSHSTLLLRCGTASGLPMPVGLCVDMQSVCRRLPHCCAHSQAVWSSHAY